jgi:hypothetical protein
MMQQRSNLRSARSLFDADVDAAVIPTTPRCHLISGRRPTFTRGLREVGGSSWIISSQADDKSYPAALRSVRSALFARRTLTNAADSVDLPITKYGLKINDFVVRGGVGRIVPTEVQEDDPEFRRGWFLINWVKVRETSRLRIYKGVGLGLRKLADPPTVACSGDLDVVTT